MDAVRVRRRGAARPRRDDEDGAALIEALALAAGFTLTVLDAVATYSWLSAGVAQEGNPLILTLMDALGDLSALSVRVAVGGTLLVALWTLTPHAQLARTGLFGGVAVLGAVGLWHLQGFVHLISA